MAVNVALGTRCRPSAAFAAMGAVNVTLGPNNPPSATFAAERR